MELYKKHVIEIFKCNFSYNIVDTDLGEAVEMPSRDAFLFSATTGARYFENPVYPFTPKGLLKLFYNAFDYNFVTGIFENHSLKNTPYALSKAKPYLFDDKPKYVVPIEFDSDAKLYNLLEKIFNRLKMPEQYLIMRIETNKLGNGMEPFMEYLAAEYFKSKGYIVENQIPLAHSLGSPDFGGYALEDTFKVLNSLKVLSNGFHILELSMLRLYLNNRILENTNHNKLIVGEAKTGTKIMTKQLEKYLKTGLFDYGIEIHPNKQGPDKGSFGLFTIDDHCKLRFIKPQATYESNSIYSKSDYLNWLNNYMKFYVLANLTNDEFISYFAAETGRAISSKEDISSFVVNKTMGDHLKYVLHIIRK